MSQEDDSLSGISLAGIKSFIDINGGISRFAALTTAEVCDFFIKPATHASGLSYCALYKQHAGEANVFVSHAWSYFFLSVLSALESWSNKRLEKSPEIYFWFDVFTVRQHGTVLRGLEWWTGIFAETIRRIGHTILVLEWADPKPLARVWCVWELASTLRSCSKLEIIMTKEEEASFCEALVSDFDAVVKKTCAVDVSTAKAWIESDRIGIFAAISATVGVSETNKLLIETMRNWMAQQGCNVVACLGDEKKPAERIQSLTAVARLLHGQGDLDSAGRLYRKAIETAEEPAFLANGRSDALSLSAISGLAELLTDRGEPAEAEELFQRALAGLASSEVVARAKIVRARARLLGYMGRRSEAKDALFRVLGELQQDSIGRESGPHYEEIARCTHRLAIFSREQGALDDSVRLFETVEAIYLGFHFGPRHPETLEYLVAIAWSIGRVARIDAEQRLCDAAALCREVLGDMHITTLRAIANLSAWLHGQGRDSEALPLCAEALRGRLTLLGSTHRTYLRSLGEFKRLTVAGAADTLEIPHEVQELNVP